MEARQTNPLTEELTPIQLPERATDACRENRINYTKPHPDQIGRKYLQKPIIKINL